MTKQTPVKLLGAGVKLEAFQSTTLSLQGYADADTIAVLNKMAVRADGKIAIEEFHPDTLRVTCSEPFWIAIQEYNIEANSFLDQIKVDLKLLIRVPRLDIARMYAQAREGLV